MTNALKIRQKFINLMYLVFILFAFIYAPTNSLDSLLYSTKSIKRVETLMVPENEVLKNSLSKDSAFIAANSTVYYATLSVIDSIEYVIKKLDSFQTVLVEPQYKGIAGYPRNFRSASIANKVFIYNNSANQLRQTLDRIKTNMDKAGLGNLRQNIDSLLPTTTEIKNSKGADKKWSAFFFEKTPKAVLLLTTEKMKLDLMVLTRDILTQVSNMRSKKQIEEISTQSPDNTMFVVKMLNGMEVPIKLDWSAVGSDSVKNRLLTEVINNKLTGTLIKNGQAISQATFNQKAMEQQDPQQPQPPVIIKQEQLYAVIGKGAFDDLYLGVDNPVDIVSSIPAGYKQEVTVNEGEIINKSGKYYLRFKREGFTKITVSAVKGATRKLLDEKEFKIILLPNPDVYLSGYKGGIISKDIVKVAKSIELKNEANNLFADVYNCESFDVTLVPFDNPIGEIKVRGNSGSSFSAETKEVLQKVKRGDVIVLDNFKIRTPDGLIRRIPTVVYRVI
ncbi:GldM family protein [Ferruginibacter sp. SUN002]|uniref:GldM family protein n=1 Tax=Ferruginibacter sp. SUN002 TaxID=2937789 RepID=UPI003D36806D